MEKSAASDMTGLRKGRTIVSSTFSHRRLGTVHVAVRRQARRLTARWKGDDIYVTSPAGVTTDQFAKVLAQWEEHLLGMKPARRYRPGMSVECPGITFELVDQRLQPGKVTVSLAADGPGAYLCRLGVFPPEGAEYSAEQEKAVSRAMCVIAARVAPELLVPRARELAEKTGRRPAAWTISRGHRVLGHCSARGVIALSHALVFLPQELRDYVILHELAHLSEMNHSPRFHALLDSYCGGREKELTRALKSFQWPIVR